MLQFDGEKTVAVYAFKTDKLLKENLVGQVPQQRCLSEAAVIYIVSRRSEDNLLKKALLARGTFLLFE